MTRVRRIVLEREPCCCQLCGSPALVAERCATCGVTDPEVPRDFSCEPACACRPCSCNAPGGYCTHDCDGLECEPCRALRRANETMRSADPSANEQPDILF